MVSVFKAGPRVLLLTSLVSMGFLSGCLGGGDAAETTPSAVVPSESLVPTSTGVVDCAADGDTSDCDDGPDATDPTRHFHHYWGEGADERQQVDIFYHEEIEIDAQPFYGHNEDCRTIGHKEFDLETDGDNAGGLQDPPIDEQASPNPRADVVFAGTARIEVKLLNLNIQTAESGVPIIARFQYKPAGINTYLPASDEAACGLDLPLDGSVVNIPVGRGGADPPHQFFVSRWAFRIWFITQDGGENGVVPHVVPDGSSFGLQMTAINGGKASLDPAHPDLWAGSMTYDLGCTSADVAQQWVVRSPNGVFDKPPEHPLADIEWQYGKIVPLLTQKVTGTWKYAYTGQVAGTTAQLEFYAADNNKYRAVPEISGDPTSSGGATFTIPDPDETMADPPYLAQTLWRFRLVPVSPAPTAPDEESGPRISDFVGNYELCFTAHKIPGREVE